ncbi:Protein grainyhead [Eumeta japonica]|uniref:Protein grainyhead n=1 Tax=Eumeta variegata TaxID=151549 RepID=A0A4C1VF12_EUMVA|nr:Protein grainyhead [Eumeta japonica]
MYASTPRGAQFPWETSCNRRVCPQVGAGEPGEAASPSPAPSRASSAGSLLPDAAMYAAQMFAPPGTPSPTAYGEQYARQPAAFAAEPYYREYFASEGYQQRAAPPYADAEPAAPAAFPERYAAPRYHGKSVIAAAGLTVDLPSPDSGIGADAVTPRDHVAVQQVPTAGAGGRACTHTFVHLHIHIYVRVFTQTRLYPYTCVNAF